MPRSDLTPSAPERRRIGWSIGAGSIGGTRIRLHLTLFLFMGLLAALLYRQGGAAAAMSGIAFYALLFLCVLIHEFGHIGAARRLGVRTPEVVLLPIGGISRLERIPERPRDELLVALAGPAASLALAFVLILALGGLPPMMEAFTASGARALVAQLAYANLTLLVFNLIPAFPMDGGRVLRALLAWRLGRSRATRIAAAIGRGAAVLFGLVGLAWGNPILMLIALFVYFAAGSEAELARLHEATLEMPSSALMVTELERLDADATLLQAAEALIGTSQKEFPIVDGDGRMLGLLTRDGLVAGLARHGGGTPAAELMVTVPSVSQWHPLDDAVAILASRVPAIAVTDADGRLLGLITPENLLELLLIDDARGRHVRNAAKRVTGRPAATSLGTTKIGL